MRSHTKAKSMIMVSHHTKLLTLDINSSKVSSNKPQKDFKKSFQDQQKDLMLFKLIKSHFPTNNNFTLVQSHNSSPFRLPTRNRERKSNKFTDFNFKEMLSNDPESRGTFTRMSPDPNDMLKKIGIDQVHYVKKLKARMSRKVKPITNKVDAALLISRKKILPVFSSRIQFPT